MTISTEVRKAGPFIGNGSASSFPFAFKVFKAADLIVVRRQDNIGVETTLVLDSDYHVTLNVNQDTTPGGVVSLTGGALADGFTLIVSSELPYLQTTDLTNQGGFYPKVITNALDRLTIFCQQLAENLGRTLKLPITAPTNISTEIPLPNPSELLAWNETGTGLTTVSPQSLVTSIAYGTATADLFAGDGVTTTFPLTTNPASVNNLDVSIGGYSQRPVQDGVGDYSWNGGASITFVTPPPVPSSPGDKNVLVRYMQAIPVSDSEALHAQTREALRRSYAEAGFNLVDGSFETGGTLGAAADVLLQESTGVAYGWTGTLPKVVAPGFDPVGVVGFELHSTEALRLQLNAPTGPADILYAGEYLPCAVLPSKVSNLASAIAAVLSASVSSNIYPVKMRQGVYLTTGLVIPANASLIGVDIPRMGMPGNWINGESNDTHGTIFRTADTSNPLFDMRVGSKVENVNVWQNGQTTTDNPATIVPFEPVFSITNDGSGGNSDNCVVRNVSALNCYDFMEIGDGVNPVGRTIVEDVFANPMHSGIIIKSRDGDLPMLNRVFLENLFTTTPVYMPNLHAYIKANAVAFTIDYAQGVNMTDCIALSYGTGLLIQGSQAWAQIENFLADQCSLPLHVNGCDKIQINNFNFAQNVKLNGPTAVVEGAIGKQLSLSNGWFGDYYDNIKVGLHSKHTSGTITISSCRFGTSFPAVLNTGTGAVQMSACGLWYDRVVGKNISIDGGPALKSGASLGLANLNPTSPAATGWTYATPANVTAITGGVRLSGAGNNSITYNPGLVSAADNDKIYFGSQIYCLEFDLKVQNQAGSPRLDIQVINNSDVIVADAFQVCPDLSTSNSALPEGEVLHIALILPWSLSATKLRFSLPSQTSQVVEITNLDIKRVVIDKGFTGLEWFVGKTKLPGGYFNAKTGKQVMYFVDHPTGGVWSAGDEWEWAPTEVPISGKKIGGFYTGTGWLSKGTFA